jgi:hypothetical protein
MHSFSKEFLVEREQQMGVFLLETLKKPKFTINSNFTEKLQNKRGFKNTTIKMVTINTFNKIN